MPTNSMDYWIIAGVIITAIGLYITWRQFRKPKAHAKNTDVSVSKSKGVDIGATEKTKANINVDKSETVKVKIGGKED